MSSQPHPVDRPGDEGPPQGPAECPHLRLRPQALSGPLQVLVALPGSAPDAVLPGSGARSV
eukprot:scaffold131099_cov34-Prasinocladus_malaysianus.AAC.1